MSTKINPANKGRATEQIPPHRILREVYRHYSEFEGYFSSTGKHIIEHGYFVYEDDLETIKEKVMVTVSLFDLRDGLKPQSDGGILSSRKLEAVQLNVIRDMKQRDVADIMGITTVSVGQYVEQAMIQLADQYFIQGEENVF
jgi:predicted DNA-binding protein (UPF0251 family)